VVLVAGEIGHGVGSDKGSYIALKRVRGCLQTADMGVDAGYDELIAATGPHQGVEIAALEGAVAMLDENDVARLGRKRRDDGLMLGGGRHAFPPQIGLKPAVAGILIAVLCRVEDRDARGAAMGGKRCDMGDD